MREKIKVGPFTWTQVSVADAIWELDDAVNLLGMTWYCRDYGDRHPDSPFSGWRCGSGGPWPEKYASRDDAMRRVVPYLLERMKARIDETRKTLTRLEEVYAEVVKTPA